MKPHLLPEHPHAHVHFIAICGTAMGSLAVMLAERGCRVTGSDTHIYPPMSDFLEQSKIKIHPGFDAKRLEPAPDLIVIGNAVSRGNPEVEATLDRRLSYTSLPELLRDQFLSSSRPVVVTGTHGKTTTTAWIAHVLSTNNFDPSFLIAGIPHDLPRPYHIGAGSHFIIEGDEYDSAFFAKFPKFFYYRPELLLINNIEYDHADIYTNLSEIERIFRHLLQTVPSNGLILANGDDPVVARIIPHAPAPVETFGLGNQCHWRAQDLLQINGQQHFCVTTDGKKFSQFEIALSGQHNIRNALGAIAATSYLGLNCKEIATGVASFTGIRRRQELLGKFRNVTVIDDFAHHPTAVEQTLLGLRQAYQKAHLWAIFEPASATNARAIFEDQYLRAFSAADRITLATVPRPGRALSDTPFSPKRLATKLLNKGKRAEYASSSEKVLELLQSDISEGDLVVFMSNGSFGGVQKKLVDFLQRQTVEK